MITTTKGLMDEALLEKRIGVQNNENDIASWVEYWLDGECIHRSAHVVLKSNVYSEVIGGSFG